MAAARPAAVGAFVLGALALAVAAILFFGGARLFEHTTRAVVFFEGSVAGLDIGAPVTFRGVHVGSVKQMALHISIVGQARVPVTIELLPGQVVLEGETVQRGTGVERLVAAGLRAQLNLQSFVTGQLRVDLDFHSGSPLAMVAADTGGLPQIPALPSEIERLRTTLAEVPVQDLSQAMLRALLSIERLAGELSTEVGPLLGSTRRGVDAATRTLATTEQVVVRLEAGASHSLQELNGLVASAQQQLGDRGTDLTRMLGSVDRLARRAETLVASLDGLTAPRTQFRGDLEAAARDLATSASSLRGFARTIERDPSTLLRRGSSR
jgi:paraquat-inducible protein B